jgi:hypothetical protein
MAGMMPFLFNLHIHLQLSIMTFLPCTRQFLDGPHGTCLPNSFLTLLRLPVSSVKVSEFEAAHIY